MVVSKETGLEKLLNYDWYRRGSFIDHFIGKTTLEEFASAKYPEEGDFVLGSYERKISHKENKVFIRFSRHGKVNKHLPVMLTKEFYISSGSSLITCEYKIENLADTSIETDFGVEFNFGFMAGDASDRYYSINDAKPSDPRLRSTCSTERVKTVSLSDKWQGIQASVDVDKPQTLWRFPIETVSLSESGFERVYQSSVVFLHSRIKIEKEYSVKFKLSVGKLK